MHAARASLLVSVVDAAEAGEALAGGADIIDIKDPAAGSLGRAPVHAVEAIRAVTPLDVPLSAALGDGPFTVAEVAEAARALAVAGATHVKLGLRDTSPADAVAALAEVRRRLPASTRLIAVGFADFRRAGAPDPADLPALAAAAGADGCLLDTAVKDGRGLLDWLPPAPLSAFVAACRERRLLAALAGSLRIEELPALRTIGPDIVGVRGAACVGDRVHGRVSRERVAGLAQALGADVGGQALTARR
jgi:(5-formylfuran-3-yl)methyl phosphate synthase